MISGFGPGAIFDNEGASDAYVGELVSIEEHYITAAVDIGSHIPMFACRCGELLPPGRGEWAVHLKAVKP